MWRYFIGLALLIALAAPARAGELDNESPILNTPMVSRTAPARLTAPAVLGSEMDQECPEQDWGWRRGWGWGGGWRGGFHGGWGWGGGWRGGWGGGWGYSAYRPVVYGGWGYGCYRPVVYSNWGCGFYQPVVYSSWGCW